MSLTIKRIALYFGTGLGLLLLFFFGVLTAVFLGPSPAARDLLVSTVMESSAAKPLARLYFSEARIKEILAANGARNTDEVTDTKQIDVTAGKLDPKGITFEDVKGDTFVGRMMIVNDPKRMFVGTCAKFDANGWGTKLSEMIKNNKAAGGVNGGGFVDVGGMGKGGMPLGPVIQNGVLRLGGSGPLGAVMGFDGEGRFMVGNMTGQEAFSKGMKEGLGFGPALVINGNRVPITGNGGGLNPRTAIGQRADGAVLLLVIDGRQPNSLGATYQDLADVMLKYGAVNAGNLDGGSSSMMIYQGEVKNQISLITGERPIATAFLIRE